MRIFRKLVEAGFIIFLLQLNGLAISHDLGCADGDCYQMLGNVSSFVEARKVCDKESLRLARVHNEAAAQLLSKKSEVFPGHNIESYWVNIQTSVLKKFQYMNGKEYSGEPPGWPRSEPIAGETCGLVVMQNDGPTLRKAHCSLQLGFICYVGRKSQGQKAQMTFYVSLQKNWFEAREFCKSREGNLYDGPMDEIYPFNPIRQFWVGLRKHKMQYGGSKEDVLYTRWQSGSPVDLSTGCVIATASGKWQMTSCTGGANHSVICYKTGRKGTNSGGAAIAGVVVGLLMASVLVFFAIKGAVSKKDPAVGNKSGQENPAFTIGASNC